MRQVQSWLGVFKYSTNYHYAQSIPHLLDIIRSNRHRWLKITGKRHSYNTASFANHMVELGDNFNVLRFDLKSKQCYVGAATQIKDVMEFLLLNKRRLANSGNHREQTFVGSIFGSTHGFGAKASMADMVTRFDAIIWPRNEALRYEQNLPACRLGGEDIIAVTGVWIDTSPLVQFQVDSCVCNLSDVEYNVTTARAFQVLPYSDPKNPVTIINDYKPLPFIEKYEIRINYKNYKNSFKLPLRWWRLKLWWFIDWRFPRLRRWIQRALNYLKIKPRRYLTSPYDIDAQYHPFEGLDGKENPRFLLWAYKPTYTCFNTALFTKLADTTEVIQFAIREAEKINPTLLRCFIGVRILSDKSKHKWCGNFDEPRAAVDLYCSPENAHELVNLQRRIQDRFDTRSHVGKTVNV